jgi:hypothetical protein
VYGLKKRDKRRSTLWRVAFTQFSEDPRESWGRVEKEKKKHHVPKTGKKLFSLKKRSSENTNKKKTHLRV